MTVSWEMSAHIDHGTGRLLKKGGINCTKCEGTFIDDNPDRKFIELDSDLRFDDITRRGSGGARYKM